MDENLNNFCDSQVIRVNPRFASANILCVGSKALKEQFRGIIRLVILDSFFKLFTVNSLERKMLGQQR